MITALAEQAAKVEIAIKTGQNVDEALEFLSHSLVAVVKAIRAALLSEFEVTGSMVAEILLNTAAQLS